MNIGVQRRKDISFCQPLWSNSHTGKTRVDLSPSRDENYFPVSLEYWWWLHQQLLDSSLPKSWALMFVVRCFTVMFFHIWSLEVCIDSVWHCSTFDYREYLSKISIEKCRDGSHMLLNFKDLKCEIHCFVHWFHWFFINHSCIPEYFSHVRTTFDICSWLVLQMTVKRDFESVLKQIAAIPLETVPRAILPSEWIFLRIWLMTKRLPVPLSASKKITLQSS